MRERLKYTPYIEEGVRRFLYNPHLLQDDRIFWQFFRLNIAQFNYILDLIKDSLKKGSSSRYLYPTRQI